MASILPLSNGSVGRILRVDVADTKDSAGAAVAFTPLSGAIPDADELLRKHNIFFTERHGEFPVVDGNCHSIEDVRKSVNSGHDIDTSFTSCGSCCCCIWTCGLGVCCNQVVVDQGTLLCFGLPLFV